MLLNIPTTQSSVQGLTIGVEHIDEPITTGVSDSDCIASEYLWLYVDHDGSNPMCHTDKCHWQFCITVAITDDHLLFKLAEDSPYELYCLKKDEKILSAEVTEKNLDGYMCLVLIIKTLFYCEESTTIFLLKKYARLN